MSKIKNTIVSICVQTYNQTDYIKECLDGILMQKTDFPFEIILGEDESTDGTREICIDFADKYPDKIRLFLRSRSDVIYINGNPTGRFNFTENLKMATGKYIALCEGDDYWIDHMKLQKQVEFLEDNEEFAGSFHNTMFINEKEQDSVLKPWRNYQKNEFTLEDTISKRALFHTSSFMFRKECLVFPDWFIKIQSADITMFSIVASHGNLFRIDEYMSVYRKNDSGITNVIKQRNYHRNRMEMFRYYKKTFDRSVHSKINSIIDYHRSELRNLTKQAFKNRIKKLLKK